MRRLLVSDLLPKRARQPVKALAHIHFTELIAMDKDSPIRKIGFPVVGEEPLPAGEQHGLAGVGGVSWPQADRSRTRAANST